MWRLMTRLLRTGQEVPLAPLHALAAVGAAHAARRKVDGRETLAAPLADQAIDLAA